jgi:hypothetical protein
MPEQLKQEIMKNHTRIETVRFRRDPNSCSPKNKVPKVGVFFRAEKLADNKPSSPRIPPQIDHKNTTSYTTFSQKTLQKRRFTTE